MADMFDNAAVMSLDPAEVRVGDRIGFYWPAKAEALGALMKRDKQSDPIKVKQTEKGWELVAGLHRLKGAELAGIQVRALEVLGDADELLLAQASENLHRRDLGPIEKALFVRAMADVYERQYNVANSGLSQQQIAIRARWDAAKDNVIVRPPEKAEKEAEHTAATIAAVYSWQDQAAESLGMSVRSLRDYLLIYRQIAAPFYWLIEDMAKRPLGQQRKSVMEIAGIAGDAARQTLIETIVSFPSLSSIAEAREQAGLREKTQSDPDAKRLSTFTSTFARMSIGQKKGALHHLASQLPAGYSIVGPDGDLVASAEANS